MSTLLDRQEVLQAAHELYCVSVATRLDEIHRRNPYPQQWDCFCEWVPRLADDIQAAIIWRLIGRVEQAWGYDVGLVFHHMGIPTTQQVRPIYYLMMGCMGHGVSLADDYTELLDKASEILNRHSGGFFEAAPIDFEEIDWREHAEDAFPETIK